MSCNVYKEIRNTLKDMNTQCKILHRHVPDTSMTVFVEGYSHGLRVKRGWLAKRRFGFQSSTLDNPYAYKIHNGVSTI